jgi:hypothetical protein
MNENATCTCTDWQTHRMAVAQLLRETSFRYCPWCGKRLASAGQRDEALLEKYRQRIKKNFLTADEWGRPQFPDMETAAQSVDDYRQLTGDILGTLDLMLTYVETGTGFTADFGDIDEPFYDALETMLEAFGDLLLANPQL